MLPIRGGDAVQRQDQQAAEQAARAGEQHRFQEEAEQDAAARKAQHAQRADFARAPRHRGVHGVHGGESCCRPP